MTTAGDEEPRPARYIVALAAALHLGFLAYFLPFRIWKSRLPVLEYDYALHAYQVDRALRAFEAHRHLWSYDPFVLAGQPAGAVEDLTSKSLEAFVIGAHAVGIAPWTAFDVYVLLVHLAVLPSAWAAARLFGLDRTSSAVTMLFWVLAWWADSFLHWCWYIGMISWAAASYLVVLVVALCHRALRDHRARTYAALALAAALVTLVHPFAVLTLVAPLLVLYGRAFRRLASWEHAALFGAAGLALATTLVWIGPALAFRHYIGPIDAFLWPTASYALTDWLGLLRDLAMTGEPVRTAWRSAFFVLAALGVVALGRARDDRALPFALLIGASVALAYLSGYSSLLRQTQPYRHIAPATLTAALVAALVVVRLVRAHERFGPEVRAALLVAALASAPALARDLVGYLPGLLPHREPSRATFRPGPGEFGSSDERAPPFMGHTTPSPDYERVASAVRAIVANTGRVAAVDWVLGEYLATFGNVPTLGGIAERNVPHVAAHPLRHDLTKANDTDDPVARYLDEYAVSAVVTKGDTPLFDTRSDLLDLTTVVGPFRVYRVRRAASYFSEGAGHVAEQGLNFIRVTDARGEAVVLRFHFMETLRCRPNCTVTRAAADRDSVGFVAVHDPPSTFEIYNAYD
ncbi:MAG TPA: hypothetical protein VHC69_28375 [Polyangiaceae bacterium]|nr:hypothetical protein [Polyangiaceae bacterium]